jgi:hypothetical protein
VVSRRRRQPGPQERETSAGRHDWQEEWEEDWQQEARERQQDEALQEELEQEVPWSRYTRGEARGRKTVYIIQTCHWEYNDSFDEPSASGGKALVAFSTREKALRHLRDLQRETGGTLGIVEVYLENGEGTEHGPQTP